eukprot:m.308708 g.308708  ORF g.308708 m.308708 type:complete len:713 (+) comp44572_c0_seq1:183-2321(+)
MQLQALRTSVPKGRIMPWMGLSLVLLLIITSNTGSVAGSKPSAVFVSPAVVSLGNSVNLICKLSFADCPRCSLKWYKGSKVVDTDLPNYKVQASSTVLTISKVALSDAGNYTCALLGTSVLHSLPGTVVITGLPHAVINSSVDVIRLKEGSKMAVQCSGKGNVIFVKWQLNGTSNRVQMSTSPIDMMSHVLTITDVQKADATFYSCIAYSQKEHSTARIRLIVEYPPTSVSIHTNASYATDKGNVVQPHDDILMSCQSSSEPKSRFSWLHNGTYMNVNSSEFLIRNAAYKDSGNYTCTASNRHGSVNVSHTILVERVSFVVEFNLEEALEGTELNLPCFHETDGKTVIAKQWLKNNHGNRELIESGGRYLIHSNGTLCIKQVVKTDNATFQCAIQQSKKFAINLMIMIKIPVKVLYKPSSVRNLTLQKQRNNWFNLSWLPPADNGNCPIDSYIIEYGSHQHETKYLWNSFELHSGENVLNVMVKNKAGLSSAKEEKSFNVRYSNQYQYELLLVNSNCNQQLSITRETVAKGLQNFLEKPIKVDVTRAEKYKTRAVRVEFSTTINISSDLNGLLGTFQSKVQVVVGGAVFDVSTKCYSLAGIIDIPCETSQVEDCGSDGNSLNVILLVTCVVSGVFFCVAIVIVIYVCRKNKLSSHSSFRKDAGEKFKVPNSVGLEYNDCREERETRARGCTGNGEVDPAGLGSYSESVCSQV